MQVVAGRHPGKGDDFDGYRGLAAQLFDALAVIGDDEELFGSDGDDFFAQEGPAQPFDEVEVGVYFVSPVNSYVNLGVGGKRGEGDTTALGFLSGGMGGGDGQDLTKTAVCQMFTNGMDGVNGRAARAQPHNHA